MLAATCAKFARPTQRRALSARRDYPYLVASRSGVSSCKRCTPAQLALAWLLARGDDIVPIPGTRRMARLEANILAVELEVRRDEIQQLEDVPGRRCGRVALPRADDGPGHQVSWRAN
jgi:aryl-alcohol dehydrogenase-like predicted oxidoreductase